MPHTAQLVSDYPALIPGKEGRAAFSKAMAARHERHQSAPVTRTRDGHHVGWRVPLSCTIHRTLELAQEGAAPGAQIMICCTRFARADTVIDSPLTYREIATQFELEAV